MLQHKCDPNKKPDSSSAGCPEPKHEQRGCKRGFRSVYKFYYLKSSDGKCVKKVELKEEACASMREFYAPIHCSAACVHLRKGNTPLCSHAP